MRLCPNCDQPVAEEIITCPSCGNEIGEGRKYIDDYKIVDVLHEGYSSFLCRAIRQRTGEMVMIRLFTAQSGVDEEVAARLKRELIELKKLPTEGFVRHYAIRQAPDGLWYRISEWLETESWGSLLASGDLNDHRVVFHLFHQMASIITILHREGYIIPHLILNDIILIRGEHRELEVKIDYKLSRFFDPKLDRPGPMLKKLLECHPDIIRQRPLDFRSDIWSLGKIFVELLTADLETTGFLSKVALLHLPHDAEILLKVMLADDPDLRPRSMREVAGSLERFKELEVGMPERAVSETSGELKRPQGRPAGSLQGGPAGSPQVRPQKRMALGAFIVFLICVAGLFAWYQFGQGKKDASSALEAYANQYAESLAFLVVEYWVESEGKQVYRNRAEGTAFLVDKDGYMLTSRHVVCPWLEDMALFATVEQLKLTNASPRFDYRLYLWFEGTKAFKRAARLMESKDTGDTYFLETAFSNRSNPRVFIAGIPKPSIQTRQLITSPFKDDFAVLKVEPVPEGLSPLPLDLEMNSQNIPKLSRFITLGFPLGSQTQAVTVNVSVTSGTVRRSFDHLLQVDASIYSGNSGGPTVDTSGKVIGIVSGVATENTQGLFSTATPRWDIGMVLPVTKSVEFLEELKAGRMKWNGVLDFSLETRLSKITDTAKEGRWAEAQALADSELNLSRQPQLVTAAAMMHYCTGDLERARTLFSQSLSMDAEDNEARLMLFVIDWLNEKRAGSPYRQELLDLDWRSENEFQGYLARVMEGLIDEESALLGWNSQSEKAWLYYVAGLIRSKGHDWKGSETLMRKAVLAADSEAWDFYLARSKLEQLQRKRRELFKDGAERAEYGQSIKSFNQAVAEDQTEKEQRKKTLSALSDKLSDENAGMKDRLRILEKIHELYPDSPGILAGLAFYSAADEAWDEALTYIRAFLNSGGRQNSDRMSLRLLEAGILHYQGNEKASRASLQTFIGEINDPWYMSVGEHLLGKQTEDSLKKAAGEKPENLITGFMPLGFWAEGSGEKERAIKYYQEALESFLDTWIEYDFVRERLTKLRQSSG